MAVFCTRTYKVNFVTHGVSEEMNKVEHSPAGCLYYYGLSSLDFMLVPTYNWYNIVSQVLSVKPVRKERNISIQT